MKNKIFSMIFIIITLCIYSAVSAYDSLWDKDQSTSPEKDGAISIRNGLQQGSEGEKENQVFSTIRDGLSNAFQNYPGNTRTESSIKIDSVDIFSNDNENITEFIRFLTGLEFKYISQTGDAPMQSAEVYKDNKALFTYSGQLTYPYYVQSNFLGPNTYMIYDEDRFEEKLAASVYEILDQMTEENSDLPDIESVYTMISAMRESSKTGKSADVSPDISLDSEIDWSAFEIPLLQLMIKFQESAPSSEFTYLYTDFPSWKRVFSWPGPASLPVPPAFTSSVTGTFTNEDILAFINALSQFLSDNPEFAMIMNQQINAGLIRSNPELAEREDVDYLAELIAGLKEAAGTDLGSRYVVVTIDQDSNGKVMRLTMETGDSSDPQSSDKVFVFQNIKNAEGELTEISVDTVEKSLRKPLFRALLITKASDKEAGTNTLNFRYDDDLKTRLEYKHTSDYYAAETMTKVSDTVFQYDWNGEKGTGKLFISNIPNDFGTDDTASQLEYEHTSQGKPLFAMNVSMDSKTGEAEAGISGSEAVQASHLTEEDYDMIASQIFMQIMMMTMNLM